MKKYKANVEYIDKETRVNVNVGDIVSLSDERYKEITSVLGEEALTEVKTKSKKEGSR
ncbi:hypothetical protein IR145_14330 [Streptococcus danieliae]|nr:hypothetical protein [Gemella sp. 19428wG2_WT2a]MBF0848629.1 hypothetical protein [Streptococcus danieliae]